MNPVAYLQEQWGLYVGEVTHGRVGKALKSSWEKYGVERVGAAMQRYAVRNAGRPMKVEWFAESIRQYMDEPTPELLVDATGGLTEAGLRLHPRHTPR